MCRFTAAVLIGKTTVPSKVPTNSLVFLKRYKGVGILVATLGVFTMGLASTFGAVSGALLIVFGVASVVYSQIRPTDDLGRYPPLFHSKRKPAVPDQV